MLYHILISTMLTVLAAGADEAPTNMKAEPDEADRAEVSLTVTRTAPHVELRASGGHLPCDWVGNTKTFGYSSPPGKVEVSATPVAPYTFRKWTGDAQSTNPSITLSLTTNKAVTANLNDPVILTIRIATGDAGNSTTPAVGEHRCALGSTVKIAATASEEHYEFAEWTGDIESSDNPVSVVMNGDKSIAANFTFVTQVVNPSGAEPGIMTFWHSIEPEGFNSWGYSRERFAHLCTGDWPWAGEKVREEFVSITCDDVTLSGDEIMAIQKSNTARWRTVWATGSQIGLSRHPDVQGYWLANDAPPNKIGDVFALVPPASIITYFRNTPGRQQTVLQMDQQFISMIEEADKVLWTCHCTIRFIEILPKNGEDPGDTVLGYHPDATSHMITDKDGKHVPPGEPS